MKDKNDLSNSDNKKNSGKESNLNFICENKGNYSIIISAVLLISILILSTVVLNNALAERNENSNMISSDQFEYIVNDYRQNLALIEREALEELSHEVIENKRACSDSREELKESIDEKLSIKNQEYYENFNIQISSSLVGIENGSDPFSYKFKTFISCEKGDSSYEYIDESSVSCYDLEDPLPVLCCGRGRGFKIEGDENGLMKAHYGQSLSDFLRQKGQENYSFYENASSPFIIKRCPFDPYKHHGDDEGKIMKNCRDNGYYHESRDGSCYLCRLEGKCGCEHYGFETFIDPADTNETGRVATCGSDHVIFSDDAYPGVEVIYSSRNESDGNPVNEILYLDPHGHKVKYGMSGF